MIMHSHATLIKRAFGCAANATFTQLDEANGPFTPILPPSDLWALGVTLAAAALFVPGFAISVFAIVATPRATGIRILAAWTTAR
ncbi:hypothetical protein [Saccharopolyspora sp. NPDC050642]|uniref:hypothetical protein n=1 Tax=Saccharopolyspora sp. NPDC050642 TaxID=3157099 RepID=UPI0033F08748